ncbi:MAG: hypothetical protein LRY54_02670 [Alphaproteobacteria bacterium]|nr:hypothetical protein [Alphaproteobacteria bacterium]
MASSGSLKDQFGDQAVNQAETLIGRAKIARSSAEKYARQICTEIGLADPENHIIMGPTKDLSRILAKAATQCAGNIQNVTDICRLTIVCDDVKSLDKARKLFLESKNSGFHDHMAERSGVSFHSRPRDHLTTPKRWGYMALHLRMEADLGQGRTVPFELQITHRGMWHHCYKETHRLYESIREEIETVEAQGGSIPEQLSEGAQDILEQILTIHRKGAEQYGLTKLVQGEFPKLSKAARPQPDTSAANVNLPPPAGLDLAG